MSIVSAKVETRIASLYIPIEKLSRVKRENHKRCDTMGFWDGGTGKLETRVRLLIFNILFLRSTFQSIVSYFVLSCVVKTCMLY